VLRVGHLKMHMHLQQCRAVHLMILCVTWVFIGSRASTQCCHVVKVRLCVHAFFVQACPCVLSDVYHNDDQVCECCGLKMQGRPPEEEGTGGEVDTGLGLPLATADAVATAAAGHPLGAAAVEATAVALLDQAAEVRLPGAVLRAL